jgi:predicted permease
MRTFLHDLRMAVRLLRQSPGLSTACIVTLALGIGANTTIYSFADAVLFRPLPVPNADRIVHMYERRDQPGTYPLAFADFPIYRERAASFEALAAHYPSSPLHVLINGAPESITGAVATASYFEVLQLRPSIGRFYSAGEDTVRDRDAVAVISHGLWQRRFGGDVSVLGKPLTLNGRVFTIIGVAPAGFGGVQALGASLDVWIPTAMFGVGYRYCDAFAPGCTIVHFLGRLKPGVSIEQAQREADQIAAQLPGGRSSTGERFGVTVTPARGLSSAPNSAERRQLNVFLGSSTLLLVITCANIAGLLLARATARRRHLAVRFAMGASRSRIVSHVLAESTVLAVLGGAAALVTATWTTDLLAQFYSYDSAGRPLTFDLSLSVPVVTAAIGLTLLAALLAGGIPAWHASRTDVIAILKDEGAAAGTRRAWMRQFLVGAQVAISVVLLVGATLLVGSVQRALQGPGFDPAPVITVRLRPSLVEYSRERAQAFHRGFLDRLASMPGVVSASPSVFMSMFSAGQIWPVTTSGSTEKVDALWNPVGPDYFSTLGTPLIEGREFTSQDREGAPPVAIVNEVLARRLAPDRPAVGMTIAAAGRSLTIVGVVRDAQYYVAGDAPRPQVFASYWQSPPNDVFMNDSRTFIRVTGDPAAMLAQIKSAAASVDPAVPISEAHPLRDRVAYMFQPVRMARMMLTASAVLALGLCAVGLYGVLAFSVTQRTREIGVRVAIGASRRQIVRLVLRDAAGVIAIGLAVGLFLAWNSTQLVSSMLFGIAAHDGMAFAAAPLAIIIVAGLASYLPARRATRVSPLTALRVD